MTLIDRRLQDWRIVVARRWLRRGDRVLDIGCADGALFKRVQWLQDGIGIDPMAEPGRLERSHRLLRGNFPDDVQSDERFDAIVALAVFEHIPLSESPRFAEACRRHLRSDGRVVLTVPSPIVDHALHWLMRLHLVDGMEVHQHWGLQPADVSPIFEKQGLHLLHHRRFELGANHLFVFEPARAAAP
jgi:2-polyprenyl-3-methyl-5-hydroxy-6-metoxy-1,4-benzoquinol methylase